MCWRHQLTLVKFLKKKQNKTKNKKKVRVGKAPNFVQIYVFKQKSENIPTFSTFVCSFKEQF